ncbi:MAG: hypothetical protein V3T72_07760 [Thermoanaerobaculia bacterium]
MKKKKHHRYLSKGARDRCSGARSLCAKLELHSGDVAAALERCFSPFLGGRELDLGVRRLTLLVIDAIRQLIARLLEAEWVYHDLRVQFAQERERKNEAVEEVHRMLTSFRMVDLWDRGPVVPRGAISRRPEHLLVEAARVRPHLDSPHLQLSPDPFPGFEPAPGLGADFDAATAELETAWTDFERSRICCSEAKEDRDVAMEELERHVTAVRSLLRTVCCLPASPLQPSITETEEAHDATGQRQSHR